MDADGERVHTQRVATIAKFRGKMLEEGAITQMSFDNHAVKVEDLARRAADWSAKLAAVQKIQRNAQKLI